MSHYGSLTPFQCIVRCHKEHIAPTGTSVHHKWSLPTADWSPSWVLPPTEECSRTLPKWPQCPKEVSQRALRKAFPPPWLVLQDQGTKKFPSNPGWSHVKRLFKKVWGVHGAIFLFSHTQFTEWTSMQNTTLMKCFASLSWRDVISIAVQQIVMDLLNHDYIYNKKKPLHE